MAAENITIISEGVKIEGKLNFPGSVKIGGEVIGDIKSDGTLTIGRNAKVESNVYTKDAVISGYFKGEMHVSGQIEITSTGRFIGNLIQDNALLAIEKGGLFKGKSITEVDKEKNISKDLFTVVQRLEEIYQKANLKTEYKEWLLEAIDYIED